MMGKSINDYKADYEKARKDGDSAGMAAANNGANAIRESQGQAAQKADQDIKNHGGGSAGGSGSLGGGGSNLNHLNTPSNNELNRPFGSNGGFSSPGKITYTDNDGAKKQGTYVSSPGGYKTYVKGENAALDAAIVKYGEAYAEARGLNDFAGMREANDTLNQMRNQYGYAAESADADIQFIKDSIGYNQPPAAGTGLGSNGGGGQAFNDWQQRADAENARIRAEAEAAKRAAVEAAVGKLSGQKEDVNQSYSDLFRQLYLDRRTAEKNLPQQMAAMGYTGGLSESAALQLQTGYADALRQGEQRKIGALGDIDRAISDTRLQGDISIAEQAAQLAQQGLLSYGDIVKAQLGQQNFDKQFGLSQDQFELTKEQQGFNQQHMQNQWDYGVGQDQYGKQKEKAVYMAGMGNFSELAGLWDLSEAETQALVNQYAQQNQVSQSEAAWNMAERFASYGDYDRLKELGVNVNLPSKNSGGGGGQTYKPILTYSQVMEQLQNGSLSPQAQTDYAHYYGMPYTAPIRGPGELGAGARKLLEQLGQSYMYEENKVSQIQNAMDGGVISRAEAEFLMSFIGR